MSFSGIHLNPVVKNHDASNELRRGSSWINIELKLWLKGEC